MAKAINYNQVWTDEKSHYWMVYKKFYFYEDVTGNEYITIQKDIREAVAEVRRQLDEHQIDIVNVAQQQFLDPMRGGNTIGIAVAFKNRDDLAMAKMLIECDSIHGL
jgi:alpha-amylase/alpha-mannosidase (GH57 family)